MHNSKSPLLNGSQVSQYGAAIPKMNNHGQTSFLIDNTTSTGSVVTFSDICYTVGTRKGCCGPKRPKEILKGISGIMKPGMNAILGPTGSGKSSLLDVLAGRKDPQYLRGEILIDGHQQPDNFKCMSGYVVQDDVVMGTLTVRENFAFSAALRLPVTVPASERAARVESVVNELGLSDCADSKVGTQMIRGVSGGERKRCNIGMELIIRPSVLFLDEPTTGLDASTANAVMYLLASMARQGRTIIFSIHQPRYSIYKMIDSLMLLAAGHVVYHGPQSQGLDYFAKFGFECEAHNNPPDFFLDIINGDSTAVLAAKDSRKSPRYERSVSVSFAERSSAIVEKESEDLVHELTNNYQNSEIFKQIKDELIPIHDDYHHRLRDQTEIPLEPVAYQTGFFRQWAIISRRTVLNIWRNPQTSILQFFVMLFFGFIVGGIFFQLDNDLKAGVQNRVGAFFFIVMNMVFGNLSAVELFIQERGIFVHENASGFYRVSAYFLAKVLCDVIPMRTLPTTIFATVVYFMIGFQVAVDRYFIFLCDLLLTTLCASGLSFFLSSSVSIFAIANLLIALCYVFMMVFSGLLINITSLPEWLRWLQYVSIFKYSMTTLSINELEGMLFCNRTVPANVTPPCFPAGESYLESQGIQYGNPWDLWQNQVALGSMTLIFLTLCYVQLRRINKFK